MERNNSKGEMWLPNWLEKKISRQEEIYFNAWKQIQWGPAVFKKL